MREFFYLAATGALIGILLALVVIAVSAVFGIKL